MKSILAVFLVLCFAFNADAMMLFCGSPPSGSQAVNYTEDFNATETPTNWSGSGVNYDQTSGALEGAQSMELDGGEYALYDPSYAESGGYYWTFWFKVDDDFESREKIIYPSDSTATSICEVDLNAGSTPTIRATPRGGSASTSSSTFATGSTHKIRVYCKSSTGANDGTVTVWSWNGSVWTQECNSTNGTATNAIDTVLLWNSADTETIMYDMFKDNSTAIESPD